MGLSKPAALFLLGELRRGVNFSKTLILGRQNIAMLNKEYMDLCSSLQVSPQRGFPYADDFFYGLGAKKLNFMDASAYEGADMIYDLNSPFPQTLTEKWSCVVDGGTLEHIFNFPEAIRNVMRLIEEGGHFLLFTPWNNYAGHGFYQFSPELFYRIFCEDNGYEIQRILVFKGGRWFSVSDPNLLAARVETTESGPTELFISAKRKKCCPIFFRWPQQSDYSRSWLDRNKAHVKSLNKASTLKACLLKKFIFLQKAQRFWQNKKFRRANHFSRASWASPVPQKNGIPS